MNRHLSNWQQRQIALNFVACLHYLKIAKAGISWDNLGLLISRHRAIEDISGNGYFPEDY